MYSSTNNLNIDMDIDDLLLEDEWFKNETNQYTDEKRLKTL